MTRPTDSSADHLEEVIRAARSGAAAAPELFRALSEATLLLAVKPAADGSSLPYVFSWNDQDHGAVFTSRRLTTGLPEAPGFMEIPGRELGRRWPDGLRAVINPGAAELMLVFDDAAMRRMQHAEAEPPAAHEVLSAGTTLAVGAPARAPAEDLIAAVRVAVRASPEVLEAYAFQLADGGRSGLVVGVVLVPGADEQRTMAALCNMVASAYRPAAQLDFLPLSEHMRAVVAEHVPALR